MEPVSNTALWTAAARARESARADRIFDDPYAAVLAGAEITQQAVDRPDAGAPFAAIAVRTRFFDDAILRLMAERDVRQIVVLAAGMDTRAFRLPLPADLRFFEIDRPEVLAHKADRLAGVAEPPAFFRSTVESDLRGPWPQQLAAAGFDADQPTGWLAEGLLCYLTVDRVHELLTAVTELSADGSFLLVDLVGQSFLNSAYFAGFLKSLRAEGAGWQFGTDDPTGLLAAHGWDAEVTEYGEPGADFDRPAMPDAPRQAPDYPHAYLVVATRA